MSKNHSVETKDHSGLTYSDNIQNHKWTRSIIPQRFVVHRWTRGGEVEEEEEEGEGEECEDEL